MRALCTGMAWPMSGRIKVFKILAKFSVCLVDCHINKTGIGMLQRALSLMSMRTLSRNCRWNLIYTVNNKALRDALIKFQMVISSLKVHK